MKQIPQKGFALVTGGASGHRIGHLRKITLPPVIRTIIIGRDQQKLESAKARFRPRLCHIIQKDLNDLAAIPVMVKKRSSTTTAY